MISSWKVFYVLIITVKYVNYMFGLLYFQDDCTIDIHLVYFV